MNEANASDMGSFTANESPKNLNMEIKEVALEPSSAENLCQPRKFSLLAPFENIDKSLHSNNCSPDANISNVFDSKDKHEKGPSKNQVKKLPESKVHPMVTLLDSKGFQICLALSTIIALFGPDIWVIAMPPLADGVLEGILFATLLLFLLELVLGAKYRSGYLGTFYFYLDIVAMLSLILDIPFLLDCIIGNTASSETTDNLSILRTGRLVRSGTRTTKVLRILKFVRMVKFTQFFRGHLRRGTYKDTVESSDLVNEAPNKLGVRLADQLGKRVIMGTIIMLLIVPLMEVQIVDVSYETGMELLQTLKIAEISANEAENTTAGHHDSVMAAATANYLAQHPNLLHAKLFNDTLVDHLSNGRIDQYRAAFVLEAIVPDQPAAVSTGLLRSVVLYDSTDLAKEQAVFNVLLTVLMTLLLGSGAYLFNRDVFETVVKPITKTTRVMHKLAKTLFLLSNDGNENSDTNLLEDNFIDHIVGQLVTFFNVEDKHDVKSKRRTSSVAITPSIGESVLNDAVLNDAECLMLDKQISVLDSFDEFWKDKQALQYFKVYLTSEFAVETLLFLEDIEKYRRCWEDVSKHHRHIIHKFVDERARSQVNISDTERRTLLTFDGNSFSEGQYDTAFSEMYKQLQLDNFPRFKKSHLADELMKTKKKQIVCQRKTEPAPQQQNIGGESEDTKARLARIALNKFSVMKKMGFSSKFNQSMEEKKAEKEEKLPLNDS